MNRYANAEKISLYAFTFRSRAERVLWALKEFNLSFDLKRLDPFKGELQGEEFIKINPAKKVPVLVHNEKVLTESLAIMEYLNDLSEGKKLIPTEIDEKYRFRRLMHFMGSELECYLWIADQSTRLKEYYRWPEGSSEAALKKVEENVSSVYAELANNAFAVGDNFSLADIYAYHILTWAASYGFKPPESVRQYLMTLEKRPRFPVKMKSEY